MNIKYGFILGLLLLLVSGCASGPTPQPGWYSQIIRYDEVSELAVLPARQDVMIVDSRPAARKYDKGHIPTAISIPHSQFDKMTDKLPKDKNALLIFYCGGPT